MNMVTRTINTAEAMLWERSGHKSDGSPNFTLIAHLRVQDTTFTQAGMREEFRRAGFATDGREIIWKVVDSDVYGQTVAEFVEHGRRVHRDRNGKVRPLED